MYWKCLSKDLGIPNGTRAKKRSLHVRVTLPERIKALPPQSNYLQESEWEEGSSRQLILKAFIHVPWEYLFWILSGLGSRETLITLLLRQPDLRLSLQQSCSWEKPVPVRPSSGHIIFINWWTFCTQNPVRPPRTVQDSRRLTRILKAMCSLSSYSLTLQKML